MSEPILHKERYNDLLRVIAAYLTRWRAEEGLSISEMAGELEISPTRVTGAILAEDWEPTLKDLSRLEVAMECDIIITLRNKKHKDSSESES